MKTRTLMLALAGVPSVTLVGAYLWLAHDHGTPWLLAVVVHEGGRYTLAETILYFRHFLRELPVVVLYAAASVAGAVVYGPHRTTAPSRTLRGAALGIAALLIGGAWVAAVRVWGSNVVWHEVFQSYLQDENAPTPGIHWRYHLLSTLAYLAAAVVLAALLQRALDGRFRAPRAGSRARWLGGIAAAVVGLTALCGLTAEPFLDPRYLGHQAREAGTHLLLTLPLSFAVLLAAGGWVSHPAPSASGRRPARDVLTAIAGGGFALAYLALGAIVTGAAHAARPGVPLSSLVGAHCYEHSLDYVLVLLLVTALAPAAR